MGQQGTFRGSPTLYQFADLQLDNRLRELRRGDDTIKLPKLSFDLLKVLLDLSPNLVTQDELIDRVWGENRVVTPENLTQRIAILRKSLNDDATNPVYISVLHGQGVRLIPDVVVVNEKSPEKLITKRNNNWTKIVSIFIAFVFLFKLLQPIFLPEKVKPQDLNNQQSATLSDTESTKGPSIAVLPFVNMSDDKSNEYFSDGISEEIINVLAKIPRLQVTSRTSAFFYKGKKVNIPKIARVLGVKHILEGSVRKSGNRVRITAQLIDADTDKHLWSSTYERELDDIFKLQDEISVAIVDALKETLGIELVKIISNSQTIDPEAYDLYLQGLKGIHDYTFDGLADAVTAFESAIKIVPDFLMARIKLAETYVWQIDTGSRFDRAILDTAEELIKDVIATNPDSAQAYYVRSLIAFYKRQRILKKQYAKEAYRLNPNDAEIITNYVQTNGEDLGKKKARALFNRAQQIDPLNGRIPYLYSLYLMETLQESFEAEKALKQAIKLKPDDHDYPFVLSWLYSEGMGNLIEAVKQMKITQKKDLKDPDAQRFLSMYYLSLGDGYKALEYANNAIAINTNNADAIDVKVNILIFQGEDEKALKIVNDSLINPDTVYRRVSKSLLLSRGIYILLKGNKLMEAEFLISKYFPEHDTFVNDDLPKVINEIGNIGLTSLLSIVYREQGITEKAEKLAARLSLLDEEYFSKGQVRLMNREYIYLAKLSAVQNYVDKALYYLEAAIDNGYLLNWRSEILQSPYFISLQQHPRFIALIDRIDTEMIRQRVIVEKDSTAYSIW